MAAIAVTSTILGVPGPATAVGAPAPAAGTGGPINTVTLITGDQVVVRGDRVAAVTMHKSRKALRYWRYSANGRDHVVPADAVPLVRSGQLDDRLFDVTGLVRQGYDDKNRRELPVILSSPTRSLAATDATKALGDSSLVATKVAKDRAHDFWADISAPRHATAAAAKVWLDGQVKGNLDQSVPSIGAPAAWQAGLRADGVKMAILDTGVDKTHPDLAGKVWTTMNFSTEPDSRDGNGHGTHVAATMVGGAPGGRFQGVAPGATLYNVKVLDNFGMGFESSIIDAMHWTVAQGVRVINMSLGGAPSDGSDLMSQALNSLSESSGALFVVAAGNDGADSTISRPAAADRALSVASVTKTGELSHFSSRGPRIGNYGLKPEIAAPGSDIVAAQAAGTLADYAVSEGYAKLSGTSMATPHVAGAAAILAGQHPDWKADQIKAALVGTANPIARVNQFGQGSGKVDIGRAVTQRVRAQPATIGLGELTSDQPVDGTGVYVNDSDQQVELKLSLDVRHRDGSPAPRGLFALATENVTVPAHSTAKFAVRVTPKPGQLGQFVGAVTATSGQTKVTTPVAVSLAAEKHMVSVKLTDRLGAPALALVALHNEVTGEAFTDLAEGVFQARVPAGRYRVLGQIADNGWSITAMTTFATQTIVDKDVEVKVDAAQGKPITETVDDPTARRDQANADEFVMSTVDGRNGRSIAYSAITGGGLTTPTYAIGSPRIPGISYTRLSQWQQPWVRVNVTGPQGYELLHPYEETGGGWAGSLTGPLVDVGDGSADPGDLRGKIPLLVMTPPPDEEEGVKRVRMLKDRGAEVVLTVNYVKDMTVLPLIQLFGFDDVDRLRASLAQGPVEVRAEGRRDSAYSYFNASTVDGYVPDGRAFHFDKKNMGRMDTVFASKHEADYADWTLVTADSPVAGVGWFVKVRWPQRRTDYFAPGFTWQSIAITEQVDVLSGVEVSAPMTFQPGQRREMCVFCGPSGPELARPRTDPQTGKPLPWAYRHGDKITFDVPMFGDRDPNSFAERDSTNIGTTVLTKDGAEIGRNSLPGAGVFTVPQGIGRYTVVAEATKATPRWPLSTRTKAEWTFLSQPTRHRTALSLMDIRFDLPLSDRSSAPRAVRGHVDVVHQQGSLPMPVQDLAVEASFDDGATWQPAVVQRDGHRWQVAIPDGGTQFVSLRAKATDVAGNSVTETMIRAYTVKG